MVGVSISIDNGATSELKATNITISNIHSTVSSGGAQIYGLLIGKSPGSTITQSNVSNATIYGVTSVKTTITAGFAISLFNFNNGSETLDQTLSNVTINGVHADDSSIAAGIVIAGLAGLPSDGTQITLTASNILVTDSLNNGQSRNCGLINANSFAGGVGTVSLGVVSQGGNLSDDNSCASYFTAPTDQNNVAALAASLLPLADNGGYVPTMALKEGSPAVDSGITIAGLTTDARGITRPQGTAYDSGAYESPYSKPAAPTLAKSGQSFLPALVASVLLVCGIFFIALRQHHAEYTKY